MSTLIDAKHPTTIASTAENANEHLCILKRIRDAFFDEANMQDTFEKLIVCKDFCENDYMSEIMVRCIKHQLWPMYTELGVALLQDCPHLILCYREMKHAQLDVLQQHVCFMQRQHSYSSCTEIGGGCRLIVLRTGLPKVHLNPGIVLFACRRTMQQNLNASVSEKTISNFIFQRVLHSVNVRPECIQLAEDLLCAANTANTNAKRLKIS